MYDIHTTIHPFEDGLVMYGLGNDSLRIDGIELLVFLQCVVWYTLPFVVFLDNSKMK